VASAIEGQRGQAMLRDLLTALDAMPVKRLIAHTLEAGGEVCTLGCLAMARGIPVAAIGSNNERLAAALGVSKALVKEIEFENEEAASWNETPENRWHRMRAWVALQIKDGAA